MTKDEAMKMALEALEKTTEAFLDTEGSHGQIENEAWDAAYDAQEALRQALDQLHAVNKIEARGEQK